MIAIKKIIKITLTTFGISGLLSAIGIALIGLNWNHNCQLFKLSPDTWNIIINVSLIVLLVIYCIFILIHTRGEYSKKLLETDDKKVIMDHLTKETEKLNNTIDIKRPRKNSISIKPNDDGSLQIDFGDLVK